MREEMLLRRDWQFDPTRSQFKFDIDPILEGAAKYYVLGSQDFAMQQLHVIPCEESCNFPHGHEERECITAYCRSF